MTERGTILWNGEDVHKKCLYKESDTFDATIAENHIMVNELQALFIPESNSSDERHKLWY